MGVEKIYVMLGEKKHLLNYNVQIFFKKKSMNCLI